MASTKTSVELINEAAGDIGALSPGEELSTEDMLTFQNKLDGMIEQLNEEEGIYIADKEEIPNPVFIILARLLSNVAGSATVGAPFNDQAWARDVKSLRRMFAGKPTYETLKAEYF